MIELSTEQSEFRRLLPFMMESCTPKHLLKDLTSHSILDERTIPQAVTSSWNTRTVTTNILREAFHSECKTGALIQYLKTFIGHTVCDNALRRCASKNCNDIVLFYNTMHRETLIKICFILNTMHRETLKAHDLPISVSKTNTRNFCIVTTCKVMPMYEITISKSFANLGKRYLNIIKNTSRGPSSNL